MTDTNANPDTPARPAPRAAVLRHLLRGGVEGNARLTALAAVVLLGLLAIEGETTPFLSQQLALHVFLGLALIPPVLLKLGSTGWRFARYYLHEREYVAKGPPHPFMRMLVAPVLVASTLALFGTGVLLAVRGPGRGALIGLHAASFAVWVGAMSLHVLGHLRRLPRLVGADLRDALPGSTTRQLVVLASIVAGLVLAIAALPAAHSWAAWVAHRHR